MHNKNQITSTRPGQYLTLKSKSSSLSIRVIFLQQMASSTSTPETSSDFPPQHLLRESFTRNQVTHLQISTSRRDANAYRSNRWLWRADESTLATKLANIFGNCPSFILMILLLGIILWIGIHESLSKPWNHCDTIKWLNFKSLIGRQTCWDNGKPKTLFCSNPRKCEFFQIRISSLSQFFNLH